MTHDSYDVEYVCRIIELKMGRPANEAERRAIAKIGNPRDRRRLGQLIQNATEDIDITRIELPPLPENAKESQIVDEELDPVAWRRIANLCGKPGTTARPAIPEAGVASATADFRSVPQQRGQLQAEQQQRHQRISDIAAQRKQKRREDMERRSAPIRTEPPAQQQPPAQIEAQ